MSTDRTSSGEDDYCFDDAGSETTEFWVRRALDQYERERQDDADDDDDVVEAAPPPAPPSQPTLQQQQPSSPRGRFPRPLAPASANGTTSANDNDGGAEAVQALRIVDSAASAGVEFHHVWQESTDDEDDGDGEEGMTAAPPPPPRPGADVAALPGAPRTTVGTRRAAAAFDQRVGQPVVYLHPVAAAAANNNDGEATARRAPWSSLGGDTQRGSAVSYSSTVLRLSVVAAAEAAPPRPLSRHRDLLAVEAGRAVLVCQPPGAARSVRRAAVPPPEALSASSSSIPTAHRRQSARRAAAAVAAADEGRRRVAVPAAAEVGVVGGAWRGVLKRWLWHRLDRVNCLRVGRILQVNLQFMTAHEAFLLAQVVEGLDHCGGAESGTTDATWDRAFANRNVSRLIVQAVRARYDWFYHWPTAVKWNRTFDLIGQFPLLGGLTRFPATENFPTTRNHALSSIFRLLLGPGHWLTRVLTGGRQGLVTDDPNSPAQNLSPEANGFELANRNQYGTHFGRIHTNKFRIAHRLTTDESILRTFITVPVATMTNNGVVHTLRQLAKHWHNMLSQEWGNFAHQRMEQLDPFETLRIHVPAVLLTLTSLRGRNQWDAQVLAPLMQKLTNMDAEPSVETARQLVRTLQRPSFVNPVSGGIPTVLEPLSRWLEAIEMSLDRIEVEAESVYEIVSTVELGIRLGHDIMEQVSWKVPTDSVLLRAIRRYIVGQPGASKASLVSESRIASALERTTPRDKRTLIELVRNKLAGTTPAKLLMMRVKTLLQREIRRDLLNEALRGLSKGGKVAKMTVDDWYWMESKTRCELYVYCGETANLRQQKFRHVASGRFVEIDRQSDRSVISRAYIPVAEAISRAQKALMTIELDYGKRFKYNAFMELKDLRVALRRLLVVGQMACEVLDNARLNMLAEVQRLGPGLSKSTVEPQNIVVIGGGPGGMMACLHCTENCLASGGTMKLYEARDSFAKGGSTYERAQIVRLDSRWIATMRYHLGTGFEDVFIPASGETDAQLGNAL